MRARVLALALGSLAVALVPAGIAVAAGQASPAPVRLLARADATTVRGRPVPVHVTLRDAAGRPVAGTTVRLLTTTSFLGSDREEIVDEGVTDAGGRALLSFSPAEAGTVTVTARSEGDPYRASAEASITFLVQRPVVAYHPAPVGIQAPWARSSLILVPVVGIWVAYLVVFGQIRRIRRLASEAPGPAR
jgi:hypothetical protein